MVRKQQQEWQQQQPGGWQQQEQIDNEIERRPAQDQGRFRHGEKTIIETGFQLNSQEPSNGAKEDDLTLQTRYLKENLDPGSAQTPPMPPKVTPIPPMAPKTSPTTQVTPQPKGKTGTTTTPMSPPTPKQQTGETHTGVDKKIRVERLKTIHKYISCKKIKKFKRHRERVWRKKKKKTWVVIPQVTSQSKTNPEQNRLFQVKHQNKEINPPQQI